MSVFAGIFEYIGLVFIFQFILFLSNPNSVYCKKVILFFKDYLNITDFNKISLVLEVFIALEIIQQLDGHVVQPLVVGKNVNLGPVTMIFALLLGANIGGILGMLVSVPLIAILKNLCIILTNKYRKTLIN